MSTCFEHPKEFLFGRLAVDLGKESRVYVLPHLVSNEYVCDLGKEKGGSIFHLDVGRGVYLRRSMLVREV